MADQEHRVERRLAAIFAADVAGYSRLMEQNEIGTLHALTAHREVMDRLIAEHGGRIANTAGDSVLAEFPSAVDAVQCAVDIQEALAVAIQDTPEEGRVRFRIGIHVGDVMAHGGDLLGSGVNIAARLQGLAEPGGVCISGPAYEYVKRVLPFTFGDLGPRQVKNIEEPLQAYALTQGGQEEQPPKAESISALSGPVVAIEPFSNLSDDAEQEYFANGLRDDLLAALLRFSGLVVLSNSTGPASGMAGNHHPSRACYKLQGSVRRSGNRARIVVKLSAPSGIALWANRYDFHLDDLFVVQDELARSIPAALKIRVEEHERENALRKPPARLEAYDLYLRGRHLERSFDHEERLQARSMFEAAIRADPRFARGYLGLAWFEIRTLKWSEPSDAKTVLSCAYGAASTALALDPKDADCHWVLGLIHLWKRNATSALAAYARARAICPNHADLLADMADTLTYLGRHDEAVEIGKTALDLNPNRPDWYLWNVAAGYYLSGDYQSALKYLIEMAQPGPAYRLLAATYAQLGLAKEASTAAAELLKLNPGFSISQFAAQAPYIHANDLAHYVEGLRKAGLPQ